MIAAFQSVATFATEPAGFVSIGLAIALLILVRRSTSGRRRTD